MATKDVKKTESKPEATPQSQWWSGRSLMDLRRQMDDLFEDFINGFDVPSWWGGRRSTPATGVGLGLADVRFDVAETEKAFEVTAELPGMEEKDIDVEVSNGTLTIKGEKTAESESKEKSYYLSERSYGAFHRSFRLPDSVDADDISANFDKGVLTVTLPKKPEAQSKPKKISVKAK